MKNIYSLLLISLFVACTNGKEQSVEELIASDDAVAIQKKKDELVNQQQALAVQIKQLDNKLQSISPDRNVPLITTFLAQPKEFKHYLELQGSVETKQNIVITPETGGIITNIYVKEGQNVIKGQLLASIDDGGLSQQKAQLEIQADLAKTTFERQKRLWDQKIGSEIQYLQAKSQYEGLQKSIAQINQQLSKNSVRAPFSGIIDDVITEQGNVAAPGQTPLMRLVNLSDMYIKTDVPESYITSINKGKEVEIDFPVLGKSITSKIRQTGNFINPANRTFDVEIAVPNKDRSIKPNLTARLKINDYVNENAILIPQSIISENAEGQQYVYILTEKNGDIATAKRVIIKTGRTQQDNIEVLAGLEENAEIIKEGARSVKDGQTVKILESENSNA
ncbi:efflux RND transporter periplasmic adaptor subunit [Winogradskyella aquimaris]|uniref:Efflux RND transporter periplasmic adaptor subunit n=1 Tax=Winogradskyella aquimaris TaxID=864074 RepID=A0ABU5EIX4_9FLAO|nr:efflux RND transporter periplasmic adaptor subunit [Winogradskyella aquimaris]MDY2585934.1 efflux RND transporter periplasmic adaptor subunit [Winogradskyella aquimaris]